MSRLQNQNNSKIIRQNVSFQLLSAFSFKIRIDGGPRIMPQDME